MKKFTLLLAALIAFALVACEKEESNPNEENSLGYITISINGASSTRAYDDEEYPAANSNESVIQTLEIYIFNADNSLDSESGYTYVSSYSGNQQLRVESGLQKKILVSANTNIGAPTGSDGYTEVKQYLSSLELDQTNSRTAPTLFYMSGEAKVDVTANVTDQRVYVTISRLLSKIEAPTAASTVVALPPADVEELFPGKTGTVTFSFDGYAIANGVTKSDAFNYWNATNTEFATWDLWNRKPYFTSTFNSTTKAYDEVYSGQTTGGDWFIDPADDEIVYVYENSPTKVTVNGVIGSKKSEVYALIVKGTLSLNGTDVERYWRVNLMRTENHQTYRNSIIRVSLDKIISKGYETPEEAEEDEDNGPIVVDPNQTTILVTIDVAPWRVWNLPTEM